MSDPDFCVPVPVSAPCTAPASALHISCMFCLGGPEGNFSLVVTFQIHSP